MEKILLEELTAKTRALMEAPTCSAEAKAAAQRWLDAVGTDAESEARESYIAELEEDIMPIGKLIGFASVTIGGVVIDDFKVVNGENGIFLGSPSKADANSRTGYRNTVRVTDRDLKARMDAVTAEAYGQAVDKLLARAEAVRPAPIKEQMAKAAKEAEKQNAARPAPVKGKEVRDAR